MELRFTIVRILLCGEALLFIPGLPAWAKLAGASTATLAYLLCLGIFSGVALAALTARKPTARFWVWGSALTNLPVYPALTPVGLILAGLLVWLEPTAVQPGSWRPRFNFGWGTLRTSGYAWVLTLAFCWAGTAEVHRFALTSGLPATPVLLQFGGLLLALPLCLLVHRAGHWLAAGQARLEETHAWSGWADPQPSACNEGNVSGRLLGWAIGGPIASLTLGAVLIGLLLWTPGTSLAGFGEMAGLAAVGSLAVFLISILPWTAAGHRSDGKLLYIILSGGAEYRRERALALLAGSWRLGVRPQAWDPAHLRVAAGIADRSRQHATACALNYLYCVDQDYRSSAQYWIARLAGEYAEDRTAVPVRWRMEIAFYLAAYDSSSRSGQAARWRRLAGRSPAAVPAPVLLRADAALALARGDASRSATLIRAAEHAALRVGPSESPGFELDLLARLRACIADAAVADPAPPLAVATRQSPSIPHGLTPRSSVSYN